MSAIAGIVHFHEEPVPLAECEHMMRAMRAYPADDSHTLHGGPVFFGCRAQWVTPESVHERLPFYDSGKGLLIAADAILDNRAQLFDLLRVERGQRDEMTDSELILLAYERWGEEAPRRLIGEFAFMIWDERKRQLFGARDLTGHRTLYYYGHLRRFAFCTAVAPLFALTGVNKVLNEQWLAEYLAIPGMMESVDPFATAYRHIRQVPPAHAIAVRDGEAVCAKYGTLLPESDLALHSNEQYEEAFREVFREAVTARLRSRKQVAATLSGGLDSGAVASFAAGSLREAGKTLHTYSYVPAADFVDWTSGRLTADERPYIQATVRHAGNIAPCYLDFAGISPLSEVDDWLEILDAPYKYFENSFWVKGMYERARHDGVGVLLTGARGNFTISWGPAIDYYALLLKRLQWFRLYRELRLYSRRKGMRPARLLSVVGKKALPWSEARSFGSPADMPALINPAFAHKHRVLDKIREHGMHVMGTLDAYEVRRNQFDNLAIAGKNGAMGTSLSLRYAVRERDPTCDARVIRFCLSVPVGQYVQNGMDRALVRRALEGYLPDQVRLNQRVRGVQAADWVHRMLPEWRSFMAELASICDDPLTGEFVDTASVRAAMASAGANPRADHAFNPQLRLLMRCLIVHRFLKKLA